MSDKDQALEPVSRYFTKVPNTMTVGKMVYKNFTNCQTTKMGDFRAQDVSKYEDQILSNEGNIKTFW